MNNNHLPKLDKTKLYQPSIDKLPEKSLIDLKPKKTLGSKITAALVIAMVTLPVLSVGITNYYFESRGINKQEIGPDGDNLSIITETKLAQRNQILAIVLVSTGTTASIVGTISALWTIHIGRWNYQQAQQRKEQKRQLFQEFIKYLSHSLDAQEILEDTVEEAQKIIQCDRVIIVSLAVDNYGKIVAEAVSPEKPKALGLTLEEPCFETKNIAKHDNGNFYTFSDINFANLPPRYIRQLEQLEVKANLVVPISHEEQLLAILAAHHCVHPYDWQEQEQKFLTDLAKRVGFALNNVEILAEASNTLKQAKTEEYWTKLLNNIVKYLRQSQQEEEILNIAVEEVRQALKCDRVVVYSLNQDNLGLVIAESVANSWSRSLGVVIEDPCFAYRYVKSYSKGRVKAIDNIQEAKLTECYLEQLEKLEVKANLVTPILYDNKIFGLLIVHQCCAPRSWQQQEIDWVTQVASQVGLAIDNIKLLAQKQNILKQLETEAEWTQLYSDTVGYILESLQEEDIFRVTVEQVRQVLKCDRALVYSLDQKNYGIVIKESVAPGWTRAMGETLDDPCLAANYINQYSDGRVKATDNIYQAKMSECHIAQLAKLEVKANLVTPILYKQKLFGLLIAHQCSGPRSWQQHEIHWLTQVAKQVGFALDKVEIIKQSQTLALPSKNPEKRKSEIVPINHNSQEIDQDIALVKEKLAETQAKIQQINQTSQKLSKIEDSINHKFNEN